MTNALKNALALLMERGLVVEVEETVYVSGDGDELIQDAVPVTDTAVASLVEVAT